MDDPGRSGLVARPGVREPVIPSSLLAARTSVPAAHPGVVPRPRLWSALDESADVPVTVITAPAGSGKSQLVASWARRGDRTTAWLALDPSDGDPHRFWTALIHALRRALPEGVSPALATMEPAPSSDHSLALLPALVIDALSEFDLPLVIVLDDVHEIDGSPSVDALSYFLLHLPRHVHVVLCGIFLPGIPRARLRSEGRLTVLDGSTLAFTEEEAEFLLREAGIEHASELAADLVRRTEGWSAGLRLAALSGYEAVESMARSRKFTAAAVEADEYLAGEVLAGLPDHIRSFLFETCVCDRLTASLADSLTGRDDGAAVLAWLVERNVFTEREASDGDWYRYHSMFAAMLRRQLARRPQEERSRLHDRAAEWLADHGLPVLAFQHAVQANSPELAREILCGSWLSLYLGGAQVTLREMVERMLTLTDPASSPELLRIRRVVGLALGEPGSDLPANVSGPELLDAGDLPSLVLALEHGRASGDLPTVRRAATRLLEHGPGGPGDGETFSDLAALALYELGVTEYWNDDRANASTHLREALAAARERDRMFVVVGCLSQLVGVFTAEDRLDDALAAADEAMPLAASRGWEQAATVADMWHALGWINYLRDDLDTADQFLDLADDAVRRDDAAVRAAIRVVRGLVLAQRGQKRKALAVMQEAEQEIANLRSRFVFVDYVSAEVARLQVALGEAAPARKALGNRRSPRESLHLGVTRSELLLSDGRPDAAVAVLKAALEDNVGFLDQRIQAMTLLSILELQQRGLRTALDTFVRTVELAAPERMIQPVLQFGARVDRLLEAAERLDTPHREFVTTLRRHLADQVASRQRLDAVDAFVRDVYETGALEEPLTAREEEVLARLTGRETIPELAAELFVSVNTVKVHLRSLYRKLGVHSRREAVAKAESLGLL